MHATAHDWIQAARPHTWPNAFAPVIVGSGAAAFHFGFDLGHMLLALLVAWSLILGVNFANDYSDGIRGTDEDRSGPLRITASGKVNPTVVKLAAFGCFGVAAIFGLILTVSSGHVWMILIGIICILGAWFYTGGSHPYGYIGLGEVAVFIFFGLIAVLGTEYTQADHISWVGICSAIGIGCISAGVNLANNIRDIPTDEASGKMTLAVRIGDSRSRFLFQILVAMPFIMSFFIAGQTVFALIALAALPLAVIAVMPVREGKTGQDLIPVLGLTGRCMIVWSVITALVLALT